MTKDAKMCGWSIEVQQRERLRPAIRVDHMGLTACKDDKVAFGDAQPLSPFEREGSRPLTEIMEHGVRACWQRQTPRMPELVVEEQGAAKANAIEHFREDVHPPDATTADGQTQ